MRKKYGEAAWDYTQKFHYSDQGQAWVEVIQGDQDDAAFLTSHFDSDNYMGEGTILQRDISAMPVHTDSQAMAASLVRFSPFSAAGGFGSRTSLNTSAYGTQPVHAYVVDSNHPATQFQQWDARSLGCPGDELALYMKGAVPQAQWMIPAQNHDYGLAIYDRATGIMRELFMAKKNAAGAWTGVGGYSHNTPGLKGLAQDNWALQQRRGLATVSGMHNSLGFVGISEALNREIRHALCFTISTAFSFPPGVDRTDKSQQIISWPSRASDGKLEMYSPGGASYDPNNPKHVHDAASVKTITHGQWGRLSADVDPMHNPETGRPYKPFTQLLIRAAKKYGLVATDTNLWCNAFNTEQGRTFKHLYGVDPWEPGGIIAQRYIDPISGKPSLEVDDFPWGKTEWASLDWGRPSPDWNLRPFQYEPWTAEGK